MKFNIYQSRFLDLTSTFSCTIYVFDDFVFESRKRWGGFLSDGLTSTLLHMNDRRFDNFVFDSGHRWDGVLSESYIG